MEANPQSHQEWNMMRGQSLPKREGKTMKARERERDRERERERIPITREETAECCQESVDDLIERKRLELSKIGEHEKAGVIILKCIYMGHLCRTRFPVLGSI